MDYRIGNDLKLRLAFVINEQRVSPDLVPFDIRVWTLYPSQSKIASFDGVNWVNCIMIDDFLEVNLDAPQFTSGRLNCDVTMHYPDGGMDDLSYDKIIKVRFDNPLVCPGVNDLMITGEVGDMITGLSAYASAVARGFVGTEEDWLVSLKQPAIDAGLDADAKMEDFRLAEEARSTAEELRDDQEIERDRQEGIRKASETGRGNSEGLRNESEISRIQGESNRNTAFNQAQGDRATIFNASELSRAESEAVSQAQEIIRGNQEAQRNANEIARMNKEADRLADEAGRKGFETARDLKEQDRRRDELVRATAEEDRKRDELLRGGDEQARKDAELLREAEEAERKRLEQVRQSQEADRQNTIGGLAGTFAGIDVELGKKFEKADVVGVLGDSETKTISQKAISDILINNTNLWYGIQWDRTENTSACVRIGSMDLHRTLPIQSKFKGCLVNKDTTFNRFLPQNSWVGEVLDGSHGQVLGRLPGFYFKVEEEGNICRYKMSEIALPGFIYQPASFPGCFEASLNNVTGELASVMNNTADYRGGNNSSTNDLLDNSFLGKPRTSTTRADYRIAARKINAGDTQWNILDKQRDEVISLLAYVEYANRNLQLPFNGALDANGFRQGGLGAGVTTLEGTKWSNWNGYNPFVPCGFTNSLGNNSGEVPMTMPFGYDASGLVNYKGVFDALATYVSGNFVSQGELLYKCIAETIPSTALDNLNCFTPVTRTVIFVNKYRCIEIPFGHIFKNLDQAIVEVKSALDNGGVASSKMYICNDPKNYADTLTSNYVFVGDLPLSSGYVKEVLLGENANLAPKTVGAGTNTYWADYYSTSIESSSLRAFLVGGPSNFSADAGFRFSHVNTSVSDSYATIGARLCLIPENE